MEFGQAAAILGRAKETFGHEIDGEPFKILESMPVGDFSIEIGKDGHREGNFLLVFRIHVIPFHYLEATRKLKNAIKKGNKMTESNRITVEILGEKPLMLAVTKPVFDAREGYAYLDIRKELLLVATPLALSLIPQNLTPGTL
jgi:hypothetical protein